MRRNSLFWGVLIILVGILFLLSNLNLLNINAWNLIWPIFLILLGVWFLWGITQRGRGFETQNLSLPVENTRQAQIDIRHGAGRLSINAQTQPGELLAGSFAGGVDHELRRNVDSANVRLSAPTNRWMDIPWSTGGTGFEWSIGLNPGIRLNMDLKTGASESSIDLSRLLVSDLRIETGASSTNLMLPENAGKTRVQVKSGAASFNIRVPQGVGGRIRVQSGLADVKIDGARFPRQGDYYQSADYDVSPNSADIYIETGVGSVDIR